MYFRRNSIGETDVLFGEISTTLRGKKSSKRHLQHKVFLWGDCADIWSKSSRLAEQQTSGSAQMPPPKLTLLMHSINSWMITQGAWLA